MVVPDKRLLRHTFKDNAECISKQSKVPCQQARTSRPHVASSEHVQDHIYH